MKSTPPIPRKKDQESKFYPIMSFKRACDIIEKACGSVSITQRYGVGKNKVIILPEANQELKTMISFGRSSPMNLLEQKFIGLGHFMVDENNNHINIITHFIEIHTLNRTPYSVSNLGPNGEYNPGLDFLEYYREEFLKNEAKLNRDQFGYVVNPFIKHCGQSEYVLEGHTHPNLGVFLSNTDVSRGKSRASKTPVCVFVCDPIRKEMLSKVGEDLAEAETIVYERNNKDHSVLENCHCSSNVEEISCLVTAYLQENNGCGKFKIRSQFGGSMRMEIILIIPKKNK